MSVLDALSRNRVARRMMQERKSAVLATVPPAIFNQPASIPTRRAVASRLLASRNTGVVEDIGGQIGQGPLMDNDSGPLYDLIAYMTSDAIDEASFREKQRRLFLLYKTHPLAHGWVEMMTQFTVGDEFSMTSCDDDPKTQEVWDKLAENMAGPYASKPWPFPIFAQEIVRRSFIFGESFEREFVNDVDGSLVYRRMHPVWIYNPGAWSPFSVNRWGLQAPTDSYSPLQMASFGIQTDPQDIMHVLYYYHDSFRNGRVRQVPGDSVIHTKIGDADMKRGESIFDSIVEYLIELEKILKARRKLHQLRTEVAWFDKVTEGADPELVKQLLTENQIQDNGVNNGRQYANNPGSAGLLNGIERTYATPNLQAADGDEDVKRVLKCIAVSLLSAYYRMSGDSEGETMASVRETSFPQEKGDAGRQRYFGMTCFEWMGKRAIDQAIAHGTLSEMSFKKETKTSKADPGIRSVSNNKVPRSRKFICDFPALQIRDPLAFSQAIQIQLTNKLISKRRAQVEFGYNPDEENAQIATEEVTAIEEGRDEGALAELVAAMKPNGGNGNGNGKKPGANGERADAKAAYRHQSTES